MSGRGRRESGGEGDRVWEGDRVEEVEGEGGWEEEAVDHHHKLATALHPVNTTHIL